MNHAETKTFFNKHTKNKTMACELCNIVNEDYRLVLKDQHAFAIVIIEPLKRHHFMVLPIRHVTSLADLTKEESKSIFTFLDRLEKAIIKASGESPIVGIHRGDHPTQQHIHIHIFPAKGDLRKYASSFEKVHPRKRQSKQQLSEIKQEILKFL